MTERRNAVPEAGRPEDDPFAELVRLVERPELFANGPLRAPQPKDDPQSFGGFEAVEVPSPSWEEFDYRTPLAAEGEAPPAAHEDGTSGRIVSRRAPADADGQGFTAAPAGADDGPEDSGIDEALLGLSAPMSPRESHPGETGSFAPERREMHHEAAARSITLDDFDELIASELAVMRPAPQAAYPSAGMLEQDYLETEDFAAEQHDVSARRAPAGERVFGRGGNRRRLMFFGSGVAAVALVGLFGAYSLFGPAGTSAGGDEPILIKADAEPVKIAPENPGGRSVPNQNKAVYERVARSGPLQGPTQEMLISAAEEPIDLSVNEEVSDLPGVMVGVPDIPMEGEVEVAQAEPAPAQPVLQPHRVKTFDVRPDGTLVPRDEAGAAAPAPTPAPAPASDVGQAVTAGAIEPMAGIRPTMPLGVEEAASTLAAAPATPAPAPLEATSLAAPVPPEPAAEPPAPAEQPAPPAEQQVAAVQPPAALETASPPAAPQAPPPAGSVFVQISSQPSQELAEQSRDNLAARYASVIGGRSLTIQSADIPDRGTYYRVRIVTASADEANTVCQSLQSAGGSCFVTR